jgi:sucrose-6-phosphate hydrolase SacC (GH32 family)
MDTTIGEHMTPNQTSITASDGDPYRPHYHFATPSGWLNDPNGLIYHDGEYHLFYQHHPDSILWGPMHWGHAVSRDLLHWQDLPIALAPDALGAIFSGSAVIDHQNTAGFGAGTMVAVFTHDTTNGQSQSLAYSGDKGRTWTKYANNPVLVPPENTPDFRDPKVFWYNDGGGTGHWVMLLAVDRSIWIYCSPDLKFWQRTDTFSGYGASSGVWECPELFLLPVDGGPQTRWVLVVSVQQGAPAGGSGQQYFIGDFDGQHFIPAEQPEVVCWADYGADFYAAQAWNAAPNGRHVWLAWMNNWEYARQTPATTWRGAMAVPRELSLVSDADGIRLIQQPIAELAATRISRGLWNDLTVAPGENPLADLHGDALELIARFAIDDYTAASHFGLRVRVGATEQTTVGYDLAKGMVYFDRSHSGQQAPGFAAAQVLALPPRAGIVELHILVDRSSVEIFANGGRVVFTNQIFPDPASQGVELFAEGGAVQIVALTAYRLAP